MSAFEQTNKLAGNSIEPVTRFDPSPGFSNKFSREDHRHQIDADLITNIALGSDNLLDNAGFSILQRTLPLSPAPGAAAFTADRWQMSNSGVMVHSIDVSTDVPTLSQAYNSYIHTVTTIDSSLAATDFSFFGQSIEAIYARESFKYGSSAARASTLSFFAKTSVAGIYNVSLRNALADRSYVASYVLEANVWTKVVLSIPGCPDGTWGYTVPFNASCSITWNLGCGSTFITSTPNTWVTGNFISSTGQVNLSATLSATFQIAGPTWTIGNSPKDYIDKGFGIELVKCMRYLQIFNEGQLRGAITTATSATRCGTMLPVRMRAAPLTSITGTSFMWDGGAGGPITSIAASYNTSYSVEHDINMSGGGFTIGRPAVVYFISATGTWTYSSEI